MGDDIEDETFCNGVRVDIMEKMKLQTQRLLSYSVVYPDRHDKIEDLLANVPSATAIEVMSYHLSQKTNQFIGDNDFNIWAPWLMKTRNDVRNPVVHYAQQYDIGNYALIDKYAMLLLISKLLTNYNGRHDELTEDSLSNLFLAYMICCDERLALSKGLPSNDMKADDFVRFFLPNALKMNDVESPRDYRLLLIRCYMLLIEFPKHNDTFSHWLDVFCDERGLPLSKVYLDELFQIYLELSSNGDFSTSLMEVDESCETTIRFLDGFAIDTKHYVHDMDFKMIRERPLIKTGPRRYDFIFMKMFLDKAYSGLLFDMKDVLEKRGVLEEKKGYEIIKRTLGDDFSERFFFYTLMERCFGEQYVRFSGDDLTKHLGKGMPDYYLRKGKRIFLFECKDAQMAAIRKLSGDYELIRDGIFDKYVKSSRGKAKGVTQLVNVITDKMSAILGEVDNTAPNGVMFIYPVIVYFDNCFDVEGPNYLLNKEFYRILEERSVSADYEVKDVVMVNIEQLMRLENFFADEKLDLAYLINSYIEYKEESELNQVFPFNKYIFQEARKVGYELKKTRWFDEVFENLKMMDRKGL